MKSFTDSYYSSVMAGNKRSDDRKAYVGPLWVTFTLILKHYGISQRN